MQYILEYKWVPNWLTQQRKIIGSNTSQFGSRYSKICPTKTSLAQLKHCVSPPGLYVSLKTLCVSPLRHCAASGTICITPIALCVDGAGPLASALSLLGSVWPELVTALTIPAFALVSQHCLCLSAQYSLPLAADH